MTIGRVFKQEVISPEGFATCESFKETDMLTDLTGVDIGHNVRIFPQAKIVHRGENLSIGDHAQIDDFAFINAGISCQIGKFTHISSFVSILGGGEFIMEDFSGLCAGCRIITGSDDFTGGYLANPTIPARYKNVILGKVVIKRYAIIGTNAIILPGVVVGEGATVGAGTLVANNLEPWGVYVGTRPIKIGERNREEVMSREAEFMKELRPVQIP